LARAKEQLTNRLIVFCIDNMTFHQLIHILYRTNSLEIYLVKQINS